jgi:hypothetical protein
MVLDRAIVYSTVGAKITTPSVHKYKTLHLSQVKLFKLI